MASIELISGDARACVVPEHGALTSSWTVGGRDIFMPLHDRSTPNGVRKRGGMPILFPNAGPLEAKDGLSLAAHGFAREMPWQVTEQSDSLVVLRLVDTEVTRHQFPYSFACNLFIALKDLSISYKLVVENKSEMTMPVAPGLHPYFGIPIDRVRTNVPGFNPVEYAFTDVLYLPWQESVIIRTDKDYSVEMSTGKHFKALTVWSDSPEYICIEPWVASEGALHRETDRIVIGPGGSVALDCVLSVNLDTSA